MGEKKRGSGGPTGKSFLFLSHYCSVGILQEKGSPPISVLGGRENHVIGTGTIPSLFDMTASVCSGVLAHELVLQLIDSWPATEGGDRSTTDCVETEEEQQPKLSFGISLIG